jgi:hypothetical protein
MRREWVANVVALVGVALALVGAFLATAAPGLSAWQNGSEIHIGPSVLSASGPGLYTGAGVMSLSTTISGETAHGAGTLNGEAVSGTCDLTQVRGGATEHCQFTVAGASLQAHDVYRSARGTWVRTYSDGTSISISVPSSGELVPVPFPLGH